LKAWAEGTTRLAPSGQLTTCDKHILPTQVPSDRFEHPAIWPEVDALGEPMELA
jgi:hypothetical protein